jgi:hypothetical protein
VSSPVLHCLHALLCCHCTVPQYLIEFTHITCIFIRTSVSLMTPIFLCYLSCLHLFTQSHITSSLTTWILQDARKAIISTWWIQWVWIPTFLTVCSCNLTESWACTLQSWCWKQGLGSKCWYWCRIPGDCAVFWVTVFIDWLLFMAYSFNKCCVFKIKKGKAFPVTGCGGP